VSTVAQEHVFFSRPCLVYFTLTKSKHEVKKSNQILSVIEKVIEIVMIKILGKTLISKRNCNHYNTC